MDLRHTVHTIFSLTPDLILKPRQDIFAVSFVGFKCQLAKDQHKYFVHGIDLTSFEIHNLESNKNSLQGKRQMALQLFFMTKITCISSSV